MIVLDEPTNHLDLEAIEWLEARLVSMSAALVLVTHDRHALDRLTTQVGPSKVVELDHGRSFVHQAAGGFERVRDLPRRSRRAGRARGAGGVDAARSSPARNWPGCAAEPRPARRSPRPDCARRTRSSSGGPRDLGVRANDLELGAGMARLGNKVVELIDVGQRFDDPTEAHRPRSSRTSTCVIEPGARLAVVGPNGSGKTTLLDIIAVVANRRIGEIEGRQDRGGRVRRSALDLARPGHHGPQDSSPGRMREPDHEDKALLEKFWFDATAQYAPVRMLSGGEKRRLQMVMVLARQPNLLLLDEPTNDLDLDTLRSLEEFLDDWPGALVVASHDRAFLDRVADHVLAIEPGGSMRRVPGGVSRLARRASRGRRRCPIRRCTEGDEGDDGDEDRPANRRRAPDGTQPVHDRPSPPRDRAVDGQGADAGRLAQRGTRLGHRPRRARRSRRSARRSADRAVRLGSRLVGTGRASRDLRRSSTHRPCQASTDPGAASSPSGLATFVACIVESSSSCPLHCSASRRAPAVTVRAMPRVTKPTPPPTPPPRRRRDDPSATAAPTDPAQSGDDVAASPGSVDDFCAAISAIQSADFELEETFGPEARVLFDDVQSAAPPEVASDVSVVVGALDALAELGISTDENDPIAVEAASEILLDPAFSEANANLVAYTSEACDIELDAGDGRCRRGRRRRRSRRNRRGLVPSVIVPMVGEARESFNSV